MARISLTVDAGSESDTRKALERFSPDATGGFFQTADGTDAGGTLSGTNCSVTTAKGDFNCGDSDT